MPADARFDGTHAKAWARSPKTVSYLDNFNAGEVQFLVVCIREAGIGIGEKYQGSMVQKFLDAPAVANRPSKFWAVSAKLAALSETEWAQLRQDFWPFVTQPAEDGATDRSELRQQSLPGMG
jgi:hypothetical protein